jgi:hypothetical protein
MLMLMSSCAVISRLRFMEMKEFRVSCAASMGAWVADMASRLSIAA